MYFNVFNDNVCRYHRMLFSVVIGCTLCGCQGPKIARDLALEELQVLRPYRQELDRKIAAEQAFYQLRKEQINKCLNEAGGLLVDNAVDRRATAQRAAWEKANTKLTEQELLVFIDETSPHFEQILVPFQDAVTRVNDEHLNSVEKITLQQKKLDRVEAGLNKLATEMSWKQRMEFLGRYVQDVRNAIEAAEGKENNKPSNGDAADGGGPAPNDS